jgi:hypothetical protein
VVPVIYTVMDDVGAWLRPRLGRMIVREAAQHP